MKTNNTEGCALCNATWGEYRDEVEGERMVFCCDICAAAFKNMVASVEKENGWSSVDSIEIQGNNNTGRKCSARSGKNEFSFSIKFHNDGRVKDFHRLK